MVGRRLGILPSSLFSEEGELCGALLSSSLISLSLFLSLPPTFSSPPPSPSPRPRHSSLQVALVVDRTRSAESCEAFVVTFSADEIFAYGDSSYLMSDGPTT